MALIIDLKPGEKVLVGDAVITNDDQRTRLHISGDSPIIREKDVMQEEDADTPCKKIYFLVQCMYLARNPRVYFDKYFHLIKEIQDAAPTSSLFFMKINDMILEGTYYKALKEAKELLKHEEELLVRVKGDGEEASSQPSPEEQMTMKQDYIEEEEGKFNV